MVCGLWFVVCGLVVCGVWGCLVRDLMAQGVNPGWGERGLGIHALKTEVSRESQRTQSGPPHFAFSAFSAGDPQTVERHSWTYAQSPMRSTRPP